MPVGSSSSSFSFSFSVPATERKIRDDTTGAIWKLQVLFLFKPSNRRVIGG